VSHSAPNCKFGEAPQMVYKTSCRQTLSMHTWADGQAANSGQRAGEKRKQQVRMSYLSEHHGGQPLIEVSLCTEADAVSKIWTTNTTSVNTAMLTPNKRYGTVQFNKITQRLF